MKSEHFRISRIQQAPGSASWMPLMFIPVTVQCVGGGTAGHQILLDVSLPVSPGNLVKSVSHFSVSFSLPRREA